MNEDVFVAPVSPVAEMKAMDSDIQEVTEQIHRLLLQVRGDKERQKSGQKVWIIQEGAVYLASSDEVNQ